jgi:3'-5' exonuclease
MKYLVVDLETVVDASLPPPPKKEDGSDAFPPIPYHQIAVMGAALLDERCHVKRIWVVGEGKGERDALAALVGYADQHRDLTLVSWNGRGFDLPVIVARCLRHGLAFPWYYAQRDARHRFSPRGHFDVMDFLVDHGGARAYSLDLAAKLIGLPGKIDCCGGDVQAMIDAGRLEDVRAYCMQDVAQTTGLFLRAQLLRGELTVAGYERAARALLGAIASERRLAPLLPLVARDRFLPTAELTLLRGAA